MTEKQVGDIILKARKRAGITQTDMIRRIGASCPSYIRWEKGRGCPRADVFLTILEECGYEIVARRKGTQWPK